MTTPEQVSSFLERLASLETTTGMSIKYSEKKWEEHDLRSMEKWSEVIKAIRENGVAFSQIQKELTSLPCREHSAKIARFKEDITFRVKASEDKVKKWVLAGIVSILGMGFIAGCSAIATGAAQRIIGKLF